MRKHSIIFVDDQKSARDLYTRILDPEKFEARVAASVAEAEELMLTSAPDLIVTDLRMPEVDGLAGIQRFHAIDPDVPIIMVTAFGSVETAVEAMKTGAFNYIHKPFDPSEFEIVVKRALKHRSLVAENVRLRSEVERREIEKKVVCASAAMKSVMELALRVAPSDYSVLILGESGTGKDVLARLIHEHSPRKDGQFISLNCSAIPEHLLESELFGYEKGAFSGATTARAGFFAEAGGGTLFLDEIGDMDKNLQPKLLRVLQNGEFYPVGSRRLRKTDVRLVCASNQDIQELVREGAFRQDLYYRIHTVSIELPPLRERVEDIPPLVEHFLERAARKRPGTPTGISSKAMRRLVEYRWPGNVRELEHAIERACLVCDSGEIQPGDLPPEMHGHDDTRLEDEPLATSYKDAREQFERTYFTRLLAATHGRIQSAAKVAGLHRSTLYEKLSRLDLQFGED